MLRNPQILAACDCHVHIVGPTSRFPQSPSRTYRADVATFDLLRRAAEPAGVSRFVLVQPSFYGADHGCLLETLDKLGENGRGVAMFDPTTCALARSRELSARGVRGLRLNFYSRSLASTGESLGESLEAAVQSLPGPEGHVEIIAPLSRLLASAEQIFASRATIVIDHYGLPDDASPQSAEGRALLDLIALPHVWVKVSAPYRISPDPLATKPPVEWLPALLRNAPDRCVWGSDWPHTPPARTHSGPEVATPYRKIDYERLLQDFVEAIPDQVLLERILSINPARLYGFAH